MHYCYASFCNDKEWHDNNHQTTQKNREETTKKSKKKCQCQNKNHEKTNISASKAETWTNPIENNNKKVNVSTNPIENKIDDTVSYK